MRKTLKETIIMMFNYGNEEAEYEIKQAHEEMTNYINEGDLSGL